MFPGLILAPRFCRPLKLLPCFLSVMVLITLPCLNNELTISGAPNTWFNSEPFNVTIVLLSLIITSIIFLVSIKLEGWRSINKSVHLFVYSSIILLLIITLFFLTENIIMLYVFFELALLPTLILILKWGYQPERLVSGFYFIMYTIVASLPLLYTIITHYYTWHTTSLTVLHPLYKPSTTFMTSSLFILAFLVKLPIWGVHL